MPKLKSVDINKVLEGATEAGLQHVIIIGTDENDKPFRASNYSTTRRIAQRLRVEAEWFDSIVQVDEVDEVAA